MRNLLPKTIEEWTAKKRQFMRLLNQTDDPRMAQDYENAINFCDRGAIALCKIEVKRKRIEELKAKIRKKCRTGAIVCFVIAGIAAVILIIGLSSCRSTIRGTGQVLQGIGTGTGTIITGVGDYLVEEGQE